MKGVVGPFSSAISTFIYAYIIVHVLFLYMILSYRCVNLAYQVGDGLILLC